MATSDERKRALNRLMAGAPSYGCGSYLRQIGELHRWEIYTHLEYERLNRKYQDIKRLYAETGQNWNQTLFMQFFQVLGDDKNKRTFRKLAERVSYNNILRERNNLMRVEALLLGASGLLESYYDDHYTLDLKREASYLMRKYNIEPLKASDWVVSRNRPKNHPIIRIAQAAILFSKYDLLLDKVLACKCYTDVEHIFGVEASEYWTTHHIPAKQSDEDVKRIGFVKCNSIAINLVVMIQYAYSHYTLNEELRDQAQNLLEDLDAESNRYITKWKSHGIKPKSAFETQALIQLSTEYCELCNCATCYVGDRASRDLSWLDI